MERTLIYGATGYTGKLIAELAVAQGKIPLLGGRNEEKVSAIAKRLNCPYLAFELNEEGKLDAALKGVDVVLNCAGPFSRTATKMADACLRTKTHYLDITGEIEVFEALATRDQAAKQAGVMLLPGVGFDVVPTDCLAVHLAQNIQEPTHLTLAFSGGSALSHGTAVTSIENLDRGGAIRRGGVITPVPAAYRTMEVDFAGVTQTCVTLPWGDVSTAFYSTGIPNIEVLMGAPAGLRNFMKATRYLGPLLRVESVQRLLSKRVPEGGPDEQTRTTAVVRLWGKAKNASGETIEAHLRTPEAYQLTARAALLLTERATNGDAPLGFQTPAKAYGPDVILDIPGTSRSRASFRPKLADGEPRERRRKPARGEPTRGR